MILPLTEGKAMIKKAPTLAELHSAYKAAEKAWKDAQTAALQGLSAGMAVDMGVAGVRGTVVQQSTRTAHYNVAAEILSGPKLRQVLADPKVDPDKVAALVSTGKLSQDDADKIVTRKASAPFIKITR
jgi:hypothetical protein